MACMHTYVYRTMHLLSYDVNCKLTRLVATLGDNGMCDLPLFESHRLEALCLGYELVCPVMAA